MNFTKKCSSILLSTCNSIKTATASISMPPCDYEPNKYVGPSYENVLKIRESNLIKSNNPYYKKPLLIHDGKMQWLFDHEGNRYLDLFGGIATISIGHCHPKVVAAAKEQMGKLWHTSALYLHPKLYEYAEKLASKFPGNLKVVHFVNSGSEANDLAILLARIYTKNLDIISFRNAYHGASLGAMGITSMSTWRYNIPVALGIHHAMNPDVYQGLWGGSHCRDSVVQTTRHCNCSPGFCRASENYFGQLEEVFQYSLPKGKVAGIIAESIQGVGGTVQFPIGFLKKAYDLVKQNGGVYIADEVQTGFGRTGEHYWGFEMHGVTPDIVTMAKGIGNGFPLGAVVTTPEIAECFKQAYHFNTFGGNPVASAIGIAVLDVIDEEDMQQRSHEVGIRFLRKLAQLRDQYEFVGDVRGKGLMIGIELVKDKQSKAPLPPEQVSLICEQVKDMGVLLGRGGFYSNVIRIKPPMCISADDVDFAVSALKKVFMSFSEENK